MPLTVNSEITALSRDLPRLLVESVPLGTHIVQLSEFDGQRLPSERRTLGVLGDDEHRRVIVAATRTRLVVSQSNTEHPWSI